MNASYQSTQLYSTVEPPMLIEPRQIPLPPLFDSADHSYKGDSDTSSNDLPLLNAYSSHLQDRSPSNTSMRAKQGRQSCGRKRGTGAWTEDEDRRLHQLVSKYGQKNWVRVEMGMENRDKKQCRERWFNHVNPNINDGPFTEEESIFIIDFYIRNGRQWAKMSRCSQLSNRPDNSIKNHFNTNLREHYAELCQRYGVPRRMQNDVSEIEKDVYDRIRGKITAPHYDTMRGTKSSRFLLTPDQLEKAPLNELMDTKSEPSRPTTHDGSPFFWQPDFSQNWSSSSPIQVRERISRTSHSAGAYVQSSMYQDDEGRYRLPPLRLPRPPAARFSLSAPNARERSLSYIDEEHKDRLWQSIQISHKPSRHNSLTQQLNQRHSNQAPTAAESGQTSTPIQRPRADSSAQAAYQYGSRPIDDSYLTSQSQDDVFSQNLSPLSQSKDAYFNVVNQAHRTEYETYKYLSSPYLH